MNDQSKKLGPRVTVSVTPGDYAMLTALANQEDVSVSWVIRRAINEYLRRHHHPAQTLGRSEPEKRAATPEHT